MADIHTDHRFDFSGSLRYDEMTGYRTVSMLVVPMMNDKGKLIGVMQMINALSEDGAVIPFSEEDELMISAIASQAAISITNIQYSNQLSTLQESRAQDSEKNELIICKHGLAKLPVCKGRGDHLLMKL